MNPWFHATIITVSPRTIPHEYVYISLADDFDIAFLTVELRTTDISMYAYSIQHPLHMHTCTRVFYVLYNAS